ncbi:hypothetical protein [Polynucleobacter sp. CS-Odin-A6]|uniref:hypothetical protein n=1 Tax=Polynucleobacter sp. CS-Odin-A6 TaxID=2689106 RepID=UPI001C0C09B7|nr:hypothetical protein [Polynucleobacter sp. CS-Odin-A6]MBU3621797.1 hypothetical protein [Polynucleobacter sp. CS-Odin-A6]
MSILLLIFAPTLFALYWLIRLQMRLSKVRYLVDAYGLDPKKLQRLKYNDIKELRHSIDALRRANDAYGLEDLVKPYQR